MRIVFNRVHFFLYIASFFRFLALKSSKIPLICDALSIPGWFVVHNHLIHMTPFTEGKIKGTQWDNYDMPEAWCDTISKAQDKSRSKKKK